MLSPCSYLCIHIPELLIQNLVPQIYVASFTFNDDPGFFFFATFGTNLLLVIPPTPIQERIILKGIFRKLVVLRRIGFVWPWRKFSGKFLSYCRCDAIEFGRGLPTIRNNLLLPSSGCFLKFCVMSESTLFLVLCEDFRSLVFSILGLFSCGEVTNYFLSCVIRKLVSCLDASAAQLF